MAISSDFHSFCCKEMQDNIHKNSVTYDSMTRDYYIRYNINSETGIGRGSDLTYCPWCGSKLPRALVSEWFNILENEYKIEVPDSTTLTNITEEFKSDAWWKKRGL